MVEMIFHTADGTLRLQGWREDTMRRAAELGTQIVREARRLGEFIQFEDAPAYVKASPFRGVARVRHALRRTLLARKVPRINEYFNLSWLIERHFQAALPLAAGVFLRRGIPYYQFIITREVPESETLLEFLDGSSAAERAPVLDEIAREVARMHALGFLHHDLYPRNLLVCGPDRPRRVVFLDAWAGGPPTNLRGPGYDLACFFLDGADLITREEQAEFLRTYFDQRAVQGRPADPGRLLTKVAAARRTLHKQLVRDPARLRGRALPSREWSGKLALANGAP